jgi:Rrf2 family protein
MVAVAQGAGGDPVSIAAVAEKRSLPASFLRQLAVGLTRAGLLGAHPGCRGGYVLARPAGSITLRDIVEALDGPIEETDDQPDTEASHALWSELGKEWAHTLDRYSLDSLSKLFPVIEA